MDWPESLGTALAARLGDALSDLRYDSDEMSYQWVVGDLGGGCLQYEPVTVRLSKPWLDRAKNDGVSVDRVAQALLEYLYELASTHGRSKWWPGATIEGWHDESQDDKSQRTIGSPVDAGFAFHVKNEGAEPAGRPDLKLGD